MLLLCSSVSVLYDLEFDLFIFFFFKRKTAYELRISDWSSDVCSSDLKASLRYEDVPTWLRRIYTNYDFQITSNWHYNLADPVIGVHRLFHSESIRKGTVFTNARSEEHTSELQSLMRISYAVFCLKNKKHNNIICDITTPQQPQSPSTNTHNMN